MILKLCSVAKKKPKTKHEKQILRDPVPTTVMSYIISDPKPLRGRYTTWFRFKIIVIILFFTGLRAGELRQFTRMMLLDLIKTGDADILQFKTKAYRKVVLSQHARKVLEAQRDSIDVICPEDDSLLYPFRDPKGNKLIESINVRLKPYAERFNLKFTSHSFRAGYITELLAKVPAQHVQELVGHSNIRSTMHYNRAPLSANAKKKLLDESYVTLDLSEKTQNNSDQESRDGSYTNLDLFEKAEDSSDQEYDSEGEILF